LDFVHFANELLLLESEELPKLIGNLTLRVQKSAHPGSTGVLQALNKIPKDPNYDNLKLEIVNQPTVSVEPAGATAASNVASPARKPAALKLQQIINQIKQIYPELKDDELYTMVLNFKKENQGTLKNLSMNDLIEKISERISPDKTECVICLNDIRSRPQTKLSCGHEFHTQCIEDWFRQKTECPMCRNFEINSKEFPSLSVRRRAT